MTTPPSKTLVVMAVAVVLLVYFRDYMRCKPRFVSERYVIQTTVEQFNSEILLERQPLIIQDYVFDVMSLVKDSMRYQYVYSRETKSQRLCPFARPMDTLAKCTFISPRRRSKGNINDTKSKDEKFLIAARPVGGKPDEDIVFRMRTHQVLILPAHWQARCVGTMEARELDLGPDTMLRSEDIEHDEDVIEIDKVEVFDMIHLFMWVPMRIIFPFGRTTARGAGHQEESPRVLLGV